MKRLVLIGGSIVGMAVLMPHEASAQERFAEQGQFVIGAERLTGIVASSQTSERDDSEVTRKYTSVNLLANPLNGITTSYSFPRIGFDYFVTNGLSIGGALGLFSLSGSMEDADGSEDDIDGSTGFLLSPRIGYAAMFSDSVGIWPRAGISYVSFSSENDELDVESSSDRLALSVEAPLVIVPAAHVAFTIAPTLDFGLSGKTELKDNSPGGITQETDVKSTEFGVQAGLLLWF